MKRTFLLIILLVTGAIGACAQTSSQPLTQAEQLELETLAGQLADPARAGKTKQEAAALLLTRPYAQAIEALKAVLEDPGNRAGQIAVAEAVAGRGNGHKAFIEPLFRMLTGDEPSVRAPAARALTTYKNEGATQRLIHIACDGSADRAVRVVTIEAMHRVLDKSAVDALVRLLGDADVSVRGAAAESLARMTNIRHFGSDAARWNQWWRENKDKDRSTWLADLAESLARTASAMEAENARLRERLAAAMTELYAATPPAQRDAMLLGLLKDPLADVRIVGAALLARKVDAHEAVAQELRAQVQAMLGDPDSRVRESAATLAASVGEGDVTAAILERLRVEEAPAVRQGLMKALSRLRDPASLPAAVEELKQSRYEAVAASAAVALARIIEKHPVSGKAREEVVQALAERYAAARNALNGTAVREAVLSAMGVVGDKAFLPAMEQALKDPAATVRLAAVNALAQTGEPSLSARLVPLVGDQEPDRGVRQAAIRALGSLGGRQHLETILQRTDPAVEIDAAVCRLAWEVAMEVLSKADGETLRRVSAMLADRPDAKDQRITVLQLLVKLARAENPADLPGMLRELAGMLAAAGHHGEAAAFLAEAHAAMQKSGEAGAGEVWLEWVAAMLAAGDPAVMAAVAGQESQNDFAAALKLLQTRLETLAKEGNWPTAIPLAEEAVKQLRERLSAQQREGLERMAADAREGLLQADRQRVRQLLRQLRNTDEASRKTAAGELQAMGQRALRPMLEELKQILQAEQDDAESEKALLAVVQQLAPKLTGYDPAAPKADRIKLVDAWLANSGGN